MRVTFPAYRGRAECSFTCNACRKPKRKRAFTVEHTVSPFNKNKDGFPKGWEQVLREAREAAALERDQFMTYPLCKRCEDDRSWSETKAINARRKSAVSPHDRQEGSK
jgi:hypothetical protein